MAPWWGANSFSIAKPMYPAEQIVPRDLLNPFWWPSLSSILPIVTKPIVSDSQSILRAISHSSHKNVNYLICKLNLIYRAWPFMAILSIYYGHLATKEYMATRELMRLRCPPWLSQSLEYYTRIFGRQLVRRLVRSTRDLLLRVRICRRST